MEFAKIVKGSCKTHVSNYYNTGVFINDFALTIKSVLLIVYYNNMLYNQKPIKASSNFISRANTSNLTL